MFAPHTKVWGHRCLSGTPHRVYIAGQMASKGSIGLLLVKIILSSAFLGPEGLMRIAIFSHSKGCLVLRKSFYTLILHLFFNSFTQNLSTFIFQFHICVINWLMPVSLIPSGQRVCLFLHSTKCEQDRHLSVKTYHHRPEH